MQMNQELLTSLTTAVSNGRTDIVRSLISAASEQLNDDLGNSNEVLLTTLNEPIDQNGTLLHLATKLDHTDIVRTLLSAGARPNVQNSNGETPLDITSTETMSLVYGDELLKAAAVSDTKRMQELIESGVSVNTQDCPMSGNTPLHWAASYGNIEAVKFLLEHEVDVNATNAMGLTPLHDAVARGDIAIIERLLSAGANPTIKATKGKFASQTPLDLASKNEDIQNLILKYTATVNGNQNHQAIQPEPHLPKRRPSWDSISGVSQDSSLNQLSGQVSNLSLDSSNKEWDAFSEQQGSTALNGSSTKTSSHALRIVSDSRLHLLWPQPQKMVQIWGSNSNFSKELTVDIIQHLGLGHEILRIWNLHAPAFKELGYTIAVQGIFPLHSQSECTISCHINPVLFRSVDAFKIHIYDQKIKLTASNVAGMHYAICTLMQLLQVCGNDPAPSVLIEDWPSLMHRAVMLDFSSDACIQTVDSIKCLIEMLSYLKINQLHIYLRFSATDCWQLPYSNKEVTDLIDFCNERFISVVPAIDIEPFLASTDLPIVSRAVERFLACFSNMSLIHIGPHITNYGSDMPMLSQLFQSLPQLTCAAGLLVCANNLTDNFNKYPFSTLCNVILVDYGHQANYEFMSHCKSVTERGGNIWVCPGTAAWNSLAGCPEASISNMWQAGQATLNHGLNGMIVADWAGSPPFVPLCFSWPGMLLGAGLSWNPAVHFDFLQTRVANLIDIHLAKDKEQIIGSVIVGLGQVETYLQRTCCNRTADDSSNLPDSKGSVLQQLFTKPDEVNLEHLTDDAFQTAIRHIKHNQLTLPKTKAACTQSAEIITELKLTTDWMIFACRLGRQLVSTGRNPSSTMGLAVINVGMANLPLTARTDLANKLLCLIERYRSVWWCRHLPSGLQSSLLLFNTLLLSLLPEGSETSKGNLNHS